MMNEYDKISLGLIIIMSCIYLGARQIFSSFTIFLTLVTGFMGIGILYYIGYNAAKVKKNKLIFPILMIFIAFIVLVGSVIKDFDISVTIYAAIVLIIYLFQIIVSTNNSLQLITKEEEKSTYFDKVEDSSHANNEQVNYINNYNYVIYNNIVNNYIGNEILESFKESVLALKESMNDDELTAELLSSAEEKQQKAINDVEIQYNKKIEELQALVESAKDDEIQLKIANESINKLNTQFEDMKSEIDKLIKEKEKIKKYYSEKLEEKELILKEKEKELKIKEELLKEQDEFISNIEKRTFKKGKRIKNKEIRKAITKLLNEAKEEINIASPWIANWLFYENNRYLFLQPIERKLRQGVKVNIIYGIGRLSGSDYDSESNSRDASTENNAQRLFDMFKNYDNFKIRRVNSHAKLITCDDKYYILTSFNILSFKGTYDYFDNDGRLDDREEIGEIIYSPENIKEYREEYFRI